MGWFGGVESKSVLGIAVLVGVEVVENSPVKIFGKFLYTANKLTNEIPLRWDGNTFQAVIELDLIHVTNRVLNRLG